VLEMAEECGPAPVGYADQLPSASVGEVLLAAWLRGFPDAATPASATASTDWRTCRRLETAAAR
jgi:hypothetical protein